MNPMKAILGKVVIVLVFRFILMGLCEFGGVRDMFLDSWFCLDCAGVCVLEWEGVGWGVRKSTFMICVDFWVFFGKFGGIDFDVLQGSESSVDAHFAFGPLRSDWGV